MGSATFAPEPFGVITPSQGTDYDRCCLLKQTLNQWVEANYTHYIVVANHDLPQFRTLRDDRTEIIATESLSREWLQQEKLFRPLWHSGKTLPVRNWVLQQIVKIAAARSIANEIIVFADPSVAFVRPFDLGQFIQGGRVRLYCNTAGGEVQRAMHHKWHEAAAHLLGVPINPQVPDFLGQVTTWRRSHVMGLCDHVERVAGCSWVAAIAQTWHFSEAVLYGLYVTEVLKSQSGHYLDPQTICHDYWYPAPLSEADLRRFLGTIAPHHVAVMVSAQAQMGVQAYGELLKTIPA